MTPSPTPYALPQPTMRRLATLGATSDAAIAAIDAAIAVAQWVPARRDLLVEGQPVGEPRLIVAGWAARVRILLDGRRQFLSFLLPGDLIGMCRQPRPLAVSTVVALTDLLVATAPAPGGSPHLAHAYAASGALEEAYLLSHIVRLGRFSAQERIGDLLLELLERLTLNGLAIGGSFDVPLTQEMLGDSLGLTPVHVNRMLQSLRRDGDLLWRHTRVTLRDPVQLARKVGRLPVRVSAPA